ncbi:MAG: citryl-CoA lyase [Candidatus Magasanikbacteria bacterium CG10_big_fil_rev_8_21_14_0_10_43_6]|uniref:citrate synthase (unknown stereospecificity) n=1 Tax=Candidatus Magasanikbacteria bacterium CG10_big_fil_rev_8_21_14_0_10_43_6 TaxID=1974650 RepID=A0A2M6W1J5_9BACT|nr:MAG: citryl-CoA lyase [Candidatus Magasanikbacteria bacterium CG10_big_fil_rev_8_21_14_0_10_43_6]
MKYTTTTTNVQADGTETVRGQPLKDIIRERTFSETIFLMLTTRFPSEAERKMVDAMLSSIIDNGPAVTSAQCARLSASAGNSMHTALAAGILGFGERHGVALEAGMHFLLDNADVGDVAALVQGLKEKKVRIPGYGHKVFTNEDPRSTVLFEKATALGIAGKYVAFAKSVHTEINAISSKTLPLNIDGALAALLCDMGFDPALGKGFFIIGRMPGLVAQVHEEMKNDVGIRRLSPEDIAYADPA